MTEVGPTTGLPRPSPPDDAVPVTARLARALVRLATLALILALGPVFARRLAVRLPGTAGLALVAAVPGLAAQHPGSPDHPRFTQVSAHVARPAPYLPSKMRLRVSRSQTRAEVFEPDLTLDGVPW